MALEEYPIGKRTYHGELDCQVRRRLHAGWLPPGDAQLAARLTARPPTPFPPCAHSQMDHLSSGLAGLHVSAPLPPEGRCHRYAHDLRSSWEGTAGSLVRKVAVKQGDVIYLQAVSG